MTCILFFIIKKKRQTHLDSQWYNGFLDEIAVIKSNIAGVEGAATALNLLKIYDIVCFYMVYYCTYKT